MNKVPRSLGTGAALAALLVIIGGFNLGTALTGQVAPSPVPRGTLLIDNGDQGFKPTTYGSAFQYVTGAGYQDDHLLMRAGGSRRALWEWSDVPEGEYEVLVTWVPAADRPATVKYDITKGYFPWLLTRQTETVFIDQRSMQNGRELLGATWQSIGVVELSRESKVQIKASAQARTENGSVIAEYVSADAVWLKPACLSSSDCEDVCYSSGGCEEAPVCGNDICEDGEDIVCITGEGCTSCPQDCQGAEECNFNDLCESNEGCSCADCWSEPSGGLDDGPVCHLCGNGVCERSEDETCPEDCHGAAGNCTKDTDCADGYRCEIPVCIQAPCVGACVPAFICGDHNTDGPEQCDDGNNIQGDTCKNDCTENICGDGYVKYGFEECDDGNLNSGDGCSDSCFAETCGNGRIDAVEACDGGMGTGQHFQGNFHVDTVNQKIYWYENNFIKRANVDGSEVQNVAETGNLFLSVGITTAPTLGKMYWTNNVTNTVWTANLDGSQPRNLRGHSGNPTLWAITTDEVRGHLYWADTLSDRIYRSNLDGSGFISWLTGESGFDFAIDPAGSGSLYIAKSTNIVRINLGTKAVETVVSGLNTAYGIALDLAAQKLYWTNGTPAMIQRSNLDGTGKETIVSTQMSSPLDVAIDTENQKLYWSDRPAKRIERMNMNGTGREVIVGQVPAQPDECRPDCTSPQCGDGIVDTGEQCDDGNQGSGDGCTPMCRNEVLSLRVDPISQFNVPREIRAGTSEQALSITFSPSDGTDFNPERIRLTGLRFVLDDPSDVVNELLLTRPGFDNVVSVATHEACDDSQGPVAENMRCANVFSEPLLVTQVPENPYAFYAVHVKASVKPQAAAESQFNVRMVQPAAWGTGERSGKPAEITINPPIVGAYHTVTGPVCGNAIIESGEECDEGQYNGDESSDCNAECHLLECGDGVCEDAEVCQGDVRYQHTCAEDCGECPGGCGDGVCQVGQGETPENCFEDCGCGDGIIWHEEQCDDGNTVSGDGCSNRCVNEIYCGNGICDATENYCACPQDCAGPIVPVDNFCNPVCGNRNVEFGEACDDGPYDPDGRCTEDCQLRDMGVCGNGICDANEGSTGCDPAPDGSGCENYVFCPDDCSGGASECSADFNGDGSVGLGDVFTLIASGNINGQSLSALGADWGRTDCANF